MREALSMIDTRLTHTARTLQSYAGSDPSKLAAAFTTSTAAVEASRTRQADAPLARASADVQRLLARVARVHPHIHSVRQLAQDNTCVLWDFFVGFLVSLAHLRAPTDRVVGTTPTASWRRSRRAAVRRSARRRRGCSASVSALWRGGRRTTSRRRRSSPRCTASTRTRRAS